MTTRGVRRRDGDRHADEISRPTSQAEAEQRVREELALEALFRARGLEVTDEDIDAELAAIARALEKSPRTRPQALGRARRRWRSSASSSCTARRSRG